MNRVRRSDKSTKRRPDQIMSGGHEQNSRPKKSPTLKIKKWRELKMRRLVVGSIGSTDTVMGGNTDRVTANTQATVKLKGRLVLIIAMTRATGLDVTSLDCPETKPVPSSSAVKLGDIDMETLRVLRLPSISRYSGVFMSHA